MPYHQMQDDFQFTNALTYPLSPLQQGMLYHTLEQTGTGMYVNQAVQKMEFLDIDAYREAWKEISARHSILRTSFHWKEVGEPYQRIHRECDIPFTVEDWRGFRPDEQEEKLTRFLRLDRRAGFDLETPPLFRITIFQVDDNNYYNVITHHHIIIDGWSGNIVMPELRTIYEAKKRGEIVKLPEPVSYCRYLDWLRERDQKGVEDFWRSQLREFQSATPLPLEKIENKHSERAGSQMGAWEVFVNRKLSLSLLELARQNKVTISTIIQAAWAILLSRHCGNSDIMFGLLVSGRPASLPGVQSIVGMFLNAIPYRVQVNPEAKLSNWLLELKALQVSLSDYEYVSLSDIRKYSEMPRSSPIFESIVSRKDTGSGMRRQHSERLRKTTMLQNVPLLLEVAASEEIELSWSYDQSRFEQGAITRLSEQLQAILQSMSDFPEAYLRDIELISPAERKQLLFEWNDLDPIVPRGLCLHQLFEQQCKRTPHQIAAVEADREMSFLDLNSASNQLARFLIKNGVDRGHRVGLCLPRSIESITGLLAILKAGAAYVPLDPSYPADRLRYMVEDAGVRIILTLDGIAQALLSGNSASLKIFDLHHKTLWENESVKNPCVDLTPEDLAYILYTSGSTGRPKGVASSHRVSVTRIFAEQPPFDEGESCCAKTSLNFIDSIWELFLPWKHGARTTLIPENSVKDIASFIKALAESGATRIVLVPSLLRAFLESGIPISKHLPNLKYWISSGEPLPEDLCALFYRLLPNSILVNIYGTTETWDITRCDSLQIRDRVKLPIGKPLPGAKTFVLNSQLGLCPVGVVGELFVGGSYLPFGYWKQPSLTAEKFCPSPFANDKGEIIYRTGDLARWLPNGFLEYVGRTDHQIKLRGFRIEPGEIENSLLRVPSIRQAVVVIRDSILTAFITLQEGAVFKSEAIRTQLMRTLPSHMVPARFIALESLPLTPNGKIDRLALLSIEQASSDCCFEAPLRLPSGQTEETVAKIWSDVLGLKINDADAHFFEIGGDSLSALRVVARLAQAFNRPISLRILLASPTIASIGEWIDSGAKDETPELEHEDSEEAPLTFTQRRLWFLDQLNPGTASYTIPNVLYLHGKLHLESLSAAFRVLIERHAVLRTVFRQRDGEPVQIILPVPDRVDIKCQNFFHLPYHEREKAARHIASEQGRIPWDLANGPLYRVQVLSLSEEEHILSTAFHHIIADGRSMGIFARELSLYYESFVQNTPLNLPKLNIQYSDFARWERRMVRGDLFQRQLAFWKSRLSGATPLEMPLDHPRPAVHQFRGKKILFEIPACIANRMRALARVENATSFMWILTGFQMLLSRYCHQNDVMIGTAMWNRSRVELEKLIGLFVNTIPMRHDFSGDPTPRQSLRRVKEGCLGAFSNMDLPFEEMLKQVRLDRDLSRQGSPLFQIMLIHQPGPAKVSRKVVDGQRGISIDSQRIDTGFSNFDLLLSTNDTPDAEVSCMLSYDVSIFKETTILRFVRHLQSVFEQFANHPDRPFSQLSFLDEEERNLLLNEWSSGERRDYPVEAVHHLIARHAKQNPNKPALQFESLKLTYSQLDQKASQLAHFLIQKNLKKEQFVAICFERSLELISSILAVMKAGCSVVTIDPSYPRDRIEFILRDTGASHALVSKATLPIFADCKMAPSCHIVDFQVGNFECCPSDNPFSEFSSSQIAYVIYTSGSTGKPKGVMVEHRQLTQIIQAQIEMFEITSESRVLQTLSLSFDAAMGEVFRTLVGGGLLLMANKEDLLPSPALAQRLFEDKVTAVAMSPTALGALPDVSQKLASLKTLTVGGEVCPPELASRWMKGRRLLNGYGPTETTIGATLSINWDTSRPPPLGRPLSNVELYVLDEFMNPVPIGVPGELFIGGVGVSRGYLNRPALTAEKFLPNPFSDQPGARFYRTGDLVRWREDGHLEFIGRIDQQVKIRGHRIELGEIESALLALSDIKSAVVIDFDHLGTKKLAAYVIPANLEVNLDVPKLRECLRKILPEYMIPAAFMVLPAFPVTPNGKIDRRNLPAPDFISSGLSTEYVAPKTELQVALADIWKEVLGVRRVGLNDNFFDLGGDSISSINVIATAAKQSLSITAKELFQYQTIEELARFIDKKSNN